MPIRANFRGRTLVGAALFLFLVSSPLRAVWYGPAPDRKSGDGGVLALDREFVHNVGRLQINITNFGLIGSRPGQNCSYSHAPSAMWPAGSGIEHLFAAGLWVGAIRNGVPLVTTGQFESEMRSSPEDPLDTVWETHQGAEGGRRFPDPSEDDDRDGLVDEDPLNGFDYAMTNIGNQPLRRVYVGFFADPDIGQRNQGDIASDDVHGWFRGAVRAADDTVVPITVAYAYDDDFSVEGTVLARS